MEGNFRRVREFLQDTFPELQGEDGVTGSNYPPPPMAQQLADLLSYIQLLLLVLFFFGESFFTSILKMNSLPDWYITIQKNPMPVLFGVFLIIPSIVNSQLTTGAFEIVLDDGTVIFSRLQSGTFPTGDGLVRSLLQAGLVRK